jgi:hypothetical protein
MSIVRSAAGALVALATLSGLAQGQRFIGTVLLPDGRTPAPGVIVAAADSTGAEVALTVTRVDGQFVLFVDSATMLSLRLLRTGFLPTTASTRRLASDELVEVGAVLGTEPVLAPSLPRGATTCRGRDAEARAVVLTFLEEARKTFLVAQFDVGRSDVLARYATVDHRTAKNGEDTLRSVYRRVTGALPSLSRATTPEELEQGGFFSEAGGERVFRTPDPAILATPWFTRTHCFTLTAEGDSMAVLAFRPTRERKGLVDVEGSYRFDARTLELRQVEFRYQGLRAEERASAAGGRLEFTHIANGDWLVTTWQQRFPVLGYRLADGATSFVRSSMTLIDVTGHRVEGGRLMALTRDGAVLWQRDALARPLAVTPYGAACPERLVRSTTGAARGRLVPEDSGRVAGVLVRVTWGDLVVVDRTQMTTREQVRETLTDDQGAWLICDLPPKRELVLKWEVRGAERQMPFTLPEANTIFSVSPPPAP